jgi:hypothetical protein
MYVVQQEWGQKKLSIEVSGNRTFGGTPFSWSDTAIEVQLEGFIFFTDQLVGGTPRFYMFQHNDVIFWTAYNNGSPSFEKKVFAGAVLSDMVDVEVDAKFIPKTIKSA